MNLLDYNLCKSSEIGNIGSARSLLESGADLHADSSYPLCVSSKNGHVEVVRLLLDAGADVHVRD